jgi:hypothetical protein
MATSYLTRDGIRRASRPDCHSQLMLTNIKPSVLGFDLRTFKRDGCNHTEKFAVETNADRRRSSQLRSSRWVACNMRVPVVSKLLNTSAPRGGALGIAAAVCRFGL